MEGDESSDIVFPNFILTVLSVVGLDFVCSTNITRFPLWTTLPRPAKTRSDEKRDRSKERKVWKETDMVGRKRSQFSSRKHC
jgi:hypothetical protein